VEIIGPPGLEALIGAMRAAFGSGLLDVPPPIRLVELAPGDVHRLARDFDLEPFKVPHTDESVAYSVSAEGRRVVITGDTGFDPALGAWAEGCDVLLCECSLPDSLAMPLHLTPRQCGALAAVAQPRRLALTHFYPPVEAEPILAQVAEQYAGAASCCEDGWSFTIEES
jgi:ribonuclease BN (tRNA processing enzyme)